MAKQIKGQKMRDIADMVKAELNGLGFALIVFEFNNPSISNYISNANKEDMTQALFEAAFRLKNDEDFKTPEENEQGN